MQPFKKPRKETTHKEPNPCKKRVSDASALSLIGWFRIGSLFGVMICTAMRSYRDKLVLAFIAWFFDYQSLFFV